MVRWSEVGERASREAPVLPIPTRAQRAARTAPTPLDAGHRINANVRRLLATLDTDKSGRSNDQIRMQNMFQSACSRITYGRKAYFMNQRQIASYNRWTNGLSPFAGIVTPRRWGKSWCLGSFVAALAMSLPRALVCIYSTGARASGGSSGLLGIIKTFLIEFGVKKFARASEEQLAFYVGTGPDSYRVIKGFPGGKDSYVFVLPRARLSPHLPERGFISKWRRQSSQRPRRRPRGP